MVADRGDEQAEVSLSAPAPAPTSAGLVISSAFCTEARQQQAIALASRPVGSST